MIGRLGSSVRGYAAKRHVAQCAVPRFVAPRCVTTRQIRQYPVRSNLAVSHPATRLAFRHVRFVTSSSTGATSRTSSESGSMRMSDAEESEASTEVRADMLHEAGSGATDETLEQMSDGQYMYPPGASDEDGNLSSTPHSDFTSELDPNELFASNQPSQTHQKRDQTPQRTRLERGVKAFSLDELMQVFASCKQSRSAPSRLDFKRFLKSDTLTTQPSLWNEMLNCYANSKKSIFSRGTVANHILNHMRERKVPGTERTLAVLFELLAKTRKQDICHFWCHKLMYPDDWMRSFTFRGLSHADAAIRAAAACRDNVMVMSLWNKFYEKNRPPGHKVPPPPITADSPKLLASVINSLEYIGKEATKKLKSTERQGHMELLKRLYARLKELNSPPYVGHVMATLRTSLFVSPADPSFTMTIYQDLLGTGTFPTPTLASLLLQFMVRQNHPEIAVEIYGQLAAAGVELMSEEVAAVLEAYWRMGDSDGMLAIYNQILESGVKPDDPIFHALMKAYYHSNDHERIGQLVETAAMLNVELRPRTLVWYMMSLQRLGEYGKVYELYKQVHEKGPVPPRMYGVTLRALLDAKRPKFDEYALELWEQVQEHPEWLENIAVSNLGMEVLGRVGRVNDMLSMFQALPKSASPNQNTYLVIIQACARNKEFVPLMYYWEKFKALVTTETETNSRYRGIVNPALAAALGALSRSQDALYVAAAMEIFESLGKDGLPQPDWLLYVIIITGMMETDQTANVWSLWERFESSGLPMHPTVAWPIAKTIERSGELQRVDRLLSQMRLERTDSENVKKKRYTWTSLFQAHLDAGDAEGVLKVHQWMKDRDELADYNGFILLLEAVQLLGRVEVLSELRQQLVRMAAFLSPPRTTDLFNRVINSYANVGDADGILATFEQMKSIDVTMTVDTFLPVTAAFLQRGDAIPENIVLEMDKSGVTMHSLNKRRLELEAEVET